MCRICFLIFMTFSLLKFYASLQENILKDASGSVWTHADAYGLIWLKDHWHHIRKPSVLYLINQASIINTYRYKEDTRGTLSSGRPFKTRNHRLYFRKGSERKEASKPTNGSWWLQSNTRRQQASKYREADGDVKPSAQNSNVDRQRLCWDRLQRDRR